MRTLRIFEHISLDGVIQIGAGPSDTDFPHGDWTGPYRSPEGFQRVIAAYGERFDVLLGRRTYDQFSAFWPKAPQSTMADRLNAATKFVVTHRPTTLGWGPAEAVTGDLVDGVRAIKATTGPDLVVAGSSTITSALLEHGLADELVLMVNPVLLGTGKRLFSDGTPPRSFELASSSAMPSGIIMNCYRFGGALKPLT